jgi:radical SAM superfamily enzyme YgiQ (UPF0313 family)
MKKQNLDRNGAGNDEHISRLVRDVWREMLETQAGSQLAAALGDEKTERLRSQFELYAQSEALTEFFGVENEEFRIALDTHLRSPKIGALFFIDILGARAWANLVFHSYCYEQIALYVKRNFDGVWNLSITDGRISRKIEERLARYVDISNVMPEYGRGEKIDLQVVRILGWPDEDMKTDVAHDLIDLHRAFNIPLFHVPPLVLEAMFGKRNFEFHVAVDRRGQVPRHPEGCWVYHETPGRNGKIIRARVPYSQYKPKLPLPPLEHLWIVLKADECKFAFEKRQELMGQTQNRKRLLFVNVPTKDSGGFKGSPTSLLYAIGPLIEETKARSPKKAIGVAGFSQLNIFDPTHYSDNAAVEFRKRLALIDPHILGFSSTSDGVHIARIMALQAKRNIDNKPVVILGGPHCDEVDFSAKGNPNDCLNGESPFDFVIAGDGEYMLRSLIRIIVDTMRERKADLDAIKEKVWECRSSLENLPGTSRLYFNVAGIRREILCRGEPIRLDELPALRYEYLNKNHLYDFDVFERDGKTMKCVQVMTHRGCFGGCNFCSERVHCYPERIKYNQKTVAAVIDEIWHYVHTFNVEAVFFDDSTFMEDEMFVRQLCRQLRASGLADRIKWGCLNRFDRVTDERLIKAMRKAGLVYMYLGLELFDDKALRRMIKFGDTKVNMLQVINRALEILKNNSIKVGVSILLGLPAESEDVERRTIEWVGRMVDEGKIHVVSLSLMNYHLASALTSSAYRQDNFDYLNPTKTILDRLNRPPWDCFEEGGWFHADERVNEDYLTRILFEVDNRIGDKKVLVRRNQLAEFITSSWDRRAVVAPEAHRLISSLSEVALSKYRVVGKYVRHDEDLRNYLVDVYLKIRSGLKVGQKSQCYSICGPSGSGKTFFVEQVASASGVKPERLDLGGTTEEDYRSKLAELKNKNDPILFMVDEIQTKAGEEWPFAELKACMDAVKDKPVTFVLIGHLDNLSAMKAHIGSRKMGEDVLRRILAGNECEIPPMTLDEKITIAVSNIRESGNQQGRKINSVEKAALFCMVLDPRLVSAGKLSDFISDAVERMQPNEERFMYDHIFRAGERERRDFWERHKQYEDDLVEKYVRISD